MGTKLADAWNESGQDERRLHVAVICRMFPDFIGRELAKVRPAASYDTAKPTLDKIAALDAENAKLVQDILDGKVTSADVTPKP